MALVSVPRGGCIGENQGVGTTIAAMGSEIVSREDLIVLFTHVIFLQNNLRESIFYQIRFCCEFFDL